jgi:hypothetical protein
MFRLGFDAHVEPHIMAGLNIYTYMTWIIAKK